jgi:hypothetical protein
VRTSNFAKVNALRELQTSIPSFPLNGEGECRVFMKRETKKPYDEQRRMVAYKDGLRVKVNALRELQSQTGEELDALLPPSRPSP